MYRCAITGILLLLMTGCASTRMQSAMSNPGGHRYTRILLFVPISDLIIRHDIETAIIREFEGTSVGRYTPFKTHYAYAWMDNDTLATTNRILYNCTKIAPLWDELSPYELDSILTSFQFDATLVVTPGAYWTTSTYIPKSASYDIDLKANSEGDITGTIHERTIGGYTVEIPHWQFDLRIYGFDNQRLIWKATSVSSGSIFDKNLPKSLAKEVAEKLQADQIIPRRTEVTDYKRK